MKKRVTYCLSIILLWVIVQAQGQRIVLAPTGETIFPNLGQPITGLFLINEGSLPVSSLNFRSGGLIIDQNKKEFSITSTGRDQAISFYVQSIIDPGFPPTSVLKLLVDGTVLLPAGIRMGGTATAGSLRWTGTAFEGYNGTSWKQLGSATNSDRTMQYLDNDIY